MFRRITLLLFLLVCVTINAFSAVFVVTSNADSGPGTLREALTKAAANGSATTDYINFNLPGITDAARTITIASLLPDLSSNLVIDGTTQPGAAIGTSKTKIIITRPDPNDTFNSGCFTGTNINDIEFYGLFFKYFHTGHRDACPIILRNCNNVTIGKLGKGNVFGAVEVDMELTKCTNITVSANVFGIDPETGMALGFFFCSTIRMYLCSKIVIGGDTKNDGNAFFARYYGLLITGRNPETGNIELQGEYCYIKNNFFGLQDVQSGTFEIITQAHIIDNERDVQITGNTFVNSSGCTLTNVATATIKGNDWGDDPNATGQYRTMTTPVILDHCGDVVIGGATAAEGNVMSYNMQTFGHSGVFAEATAHVLIMHNSIYCNDGGIVYDAHDPVVPLPVIGITSFSNSVIKGTSTPNAIIEVFADGECQLCEAKTFQGTTTANAAGNWFLAVPSGISFTASATVGKQTSLFAKVGLNTDNLVITNSSCGNNGSIKGITAINGTRLEWTNENGDVIGTTPDIDNLKPGRYMLTVYMGNCSTTSSNYELKDSKPRINDNFVKTSDIACGNTNGAITGLYVENPEDFTIKTLTWVNQVNQIVGNTLDLQNVPAGTYTLKIVNSSDCESVYGPIILKNTTGPNIDQTGVKIQSTNCGQANGSITNITVTGTGNLQYIWWNNQQQVGNSKDLTNQQAGTYKLQVLDDTQCGPIYSTDITIPETNGVTLDESNVKTTVASCSQNNGSIKGISFSGATKFQWMDANNNVVSSIADFTGAAPGVYTFTASNNFGCSKTSQPYTVGQQPSVQLPQYTATTVASCFGGKSGSVTVATDALVKSLRWVDSQGGSAGNQAALTGVQAGIYKLYITDQNGCENLYNTYTIDEVPECKVASAGQTINDQCGLNSGSVSSVSITGGVPPYTYRWMDAAGKQIGTENGISNLAAGNYVLNVVDTRCGNVDIPYIITEESAEVAAPSVSAIQLCSSGSALLSVNNASSSTTYRLYDSQNSVHQIDEQQGGKFSINVTANRSYFVTQLNGTCESPRAEVKVTVGLSTLNIANAFTPNGDGINDYWKISNIESYPDALVQIFTRYGQKVFESKGYTKPFDGTMNGKKLSPGVYYYIINLNTNCNVLSGSLTIIR